jgi:murein DD-endopeptidase MepM/ murein hydrolase activator NlpD
MVIPDSQGIARQVSVPVAFIYISIISVLLILFVSFFLAAEFFSGRVADAELERLRAENERLTEKYEQIRWTLAEVDARYADLVQKETAIRTIFGLPEISTEERQLGIGGPGSKTFDQMSELGKYAFKTELEVDRLLRLSSFELEKYAEVETELNTLKDRLRHTPSIWPARGWLSRGFGMKHDPFTGYEQMHRGIDIANHVGTPVIAPADGKVIKVARAGSMGLMVTIDHGYGFVTRYGHLSESKVKRGRHVKRGDVFALMGSTGYSTGPHLHYEVWRNGSALNPMKFILNEM